MNILFNKQPKLVVMECQKCSGALELDSNYETAHCTQCGFQYVVQNIDKKSVKKRV